MLGATTWRSVVPFRTQVASSFAFAILVLSVVFAGGVCARAQDSDAGAGPYKTKCLVCHAADGSGNTPVGKSLKSADLRAPEVQKKSDAELAELIATGKGNMPSFKSSTSDDELHALVTHIRTFGAKKSKKSEGKGQ